MATSPIVVRIAATDAMVTLEPTSGMRVKDLKQALNDSHAFPVKKQKMSINGKKIKDSQRVSEILNPAEDIIDLSVSVKGGCCECNCCCCECCI